MPEAGLTGRLHEAGPGGESRPMPVGRLTADPKRQAGPGGGDEPAGGRREK